MANKKNPDSQPSKKKSLAQGAEARWEANHSEELGPGKKGAEGRWEEERDKGIKKERPKGAESRWEREQNDN